MFTRNNNIQQKSIKVPKEHPILNNVVACLFCILVVAPLCINVLNNITENKNKESALKTEETVGEIIDYTVVTDSQGNAITFNTTINFEVNNSYYTKTFQTTFL